LRNLATSVAIVSTFGILLFCLAHFILLLSVDEAYGLAGLPFIASAHIYELLERREGKRQFSHPQPPRRSIYTLRRFALPWKVTVAYGFLIFIGIVLVGVALAILLETILEPLTGKPVANGLGIAVVTIIQFFALFFVGRWIGSRCARYGVWAALAVVLPKDIRNTLVDLATEEAQRIAIQRRRSGEYVSSSISHRLHLRWPIRRGMEDPGLAPWMEGIRSNPTDPDAYLARASYYSVHRRHGDAIRDLTSAIRLSSDRHDLYFIRGSEYAKLADSSKASADFNQAVGLLTTAIDRNPEDTSLLTTRGAAYQGMGAYDRAIADFTEAIGKNPNDHGAYRRRGQTNAWRGDFNRAIEDLNEAIRLAPSDTLGIDRSLAYRLRGEVYSRLSRISGGYWATFFRRPAREYRKRAIADYNQATQILRAARSHRV
jgi:tetratricopeptide (TPR) repeat protein